MADEASFIAAATALQQQQAAAALQSQAATLPQYSLPGPVLQGTKYQNLLQIIEELGKDIKPTYTGNKICQERLKRSIIHARILVRECLLEAEKERSAHSAAIAAQSEKEKGASSSSTTPAKQ